MRKKCWSIKVIHFLTHEVPMIICQWPLVQSMLHHLCIVTHGIWCTLLCKKKKCCEDEENGEV